MTGAQQQLPPTPDLGKLPGRHDETGFFGKFYFKFHIFFSRLN
jgi:hypothetical protein